MKPNLKDFPNGQGVDSAEFSIQVNEWKEAFEKQLQEEVERENKQALIMAHDFDERLFLLHSERARVFREILGEK